MVFFSIISCECIFLLFPFILPPNCPSFQLLHHPFSSPTSFHSSSHLLPCHPQVILRVLIIQLPKISQLKEEPRVQDGGVVGPMTPPEILSVGVDEGGKVMRGKDRERRHLYIRSY